MIVSIHQPAYLPWLGYLHRIAATDLHITLDHVQFEKNSFANRNQLRGPSGDKVWLTVPLKTAGRFGDLPLAAVEIDNTQPWQRKHWQTIRQTYRRAPFFEAHARFFESLYTARWTRLADLCRTLTAYLLDAFDIATPVRNSRSLQPCERKSALILELCQKTGADAYLSGPLGRDYLDEAAFARAGIAVRYHHYQHPIYAQSSGAGAPFLSHLAALDLLFEHGPRARNIMLGAQETVCP